MQTIANSHYIQVLVILLLTLVALIVCEACRLLKARWLDYHEKTRAREIKLRNDVLEKL